MEADLLLILSGLLMAVIGLSAMAYYVVAEKGSVLDPIAVSWGGFIIFVAIAQIGVGALNPARRGEDNGTFGVFMVFVGTCGYLFGLYVTRGRTLSSILPTPRSTLDTGQVWFILFTAGVVALVGTFAQKAIGISTLGIVFGALFWGAIYTVALVSIFALFAQRSHAFIKLVFVAALAGAFYLTYTESFSRRATLSLLAVMLAAFYHLKLRRYSTSAKLAFLTLFLVGGFLMNLWLEAVRGNLYYGEIMRRGEAFSWENLAGTLGGVTVNYEVFEVLIDQYPAVRPYLMGSSIISAFLYMIPRAIWPSKPYGAGYHATEIWFNRVDHESNVASTIMGEMYQNLGLLGVLFGMIAVGIFVRSLNTFLRKNLNNIPLWLVWFMIIPDALGQWRGDMTSMTAQASTRILIFLVLTYVAGLLFPAPEVMVRPVVQRRVVPQPAGPGRPRRPSIPRPATGGH